MFFDPFLFPNPKIPLPKVSDVVKPKHPLDSDDERAKLRDLSIGINGQPAAHETNAVLRMSDAGYTTVEIQKTLGLFPGQIEADIKFARQVRAFAADERHPVHGGDVPVGTTEYRRARDVVKGDELVQHGSPVVDIRVSGPDILFVLEGGAEVKLRGLDEILIRPAKT